MDNIIEKMEYSLLEAIHSANGDYNYDDKFYDITLDSWAQEANIFNCISNNWNISPLKKGNFGYDNLIVSLGYTLINCNNYTEVNIESIASLIHEGWIINYTYWRDYSPWLNSYDTSNSIVRSKVYKYFKPFAPLGDERRNNCAILDYYQLSQEEKDKDIILAKFLIDKINNNYEKIV